MKIAYKAIDGSGTTVANVVEAPNLEEAVESLRRDGMFVTEVQEASGREKAYRGTEVVADAHAGHLTINELMLFTRQMAMLLRAGSPVVPSLVAIAKQMKGVSRVLVETVRKDMEGGQGLAESLKQFPRTFSDVYVAIVGAGEMSANLPDMFTRLASLVGYKREIRNRIVSSAAYPLLLTGLSGAIVTVMVVFVVPRFRGLFESLGVPLPLTTKILFRLSFLVRDHWPWLAAAAVAWVVAALVVWKTDAGRSRLRNLQTRVPMFGKLFSRLIQAQMFRVMGLLLQSRVGLMDTLQLTRRISTNGDYQQLCTEMNEALQRGNRLGEAMATSPIISPAIAQAVATGEDSGHLDQALLFVADVMDEENSHLINTMTKLLEPLILVGMGLVVGGIALALFIPLFDLAAMAR